MEPDFLQILSQILPKNNYKTFFFPLVACSRGREQGAAGEVEMRVGGVAWCACEGVVPGHADSAAASPCGGGLSGRCTTHVPRP
jgi:hypothetical protein